MAIKLVDFLRVKQEASVYPGIGKNRGHRNGETVKIRKSSGVKIYSGFRDKQKARKYGLL